MRAMIAAVTVLTFGMATTPVGLAAEPANALDTVFRDANADACFVVENFDSSVRHVYNAARANQRFSPASTFKILNTLIGLDTTVVTADGIEFRWDGTDRGIAAWNQDHTLASALKVSCVWCYQEIARQVGRTRYEHELQRLDYGNARVGNHVDQFWLDGSLAISAIEQVEFLRRLHTNPLPFAEGDVDLLKDMMTIETRAGYVLRAKSGWTGADLHTGWYVGMLETDSTTWLFALNLDMDRAEQAPLRQSLTVEAFEALDILPDD